MSIAYAPTVLADSPVAYWRLGEAVGSPSAVDASGNGRTATLAGGVTLGQVGAVNDDDTAGLFDGIDGTYARVPFSFGTALAAVSFETWLKPTTNILPQGWRMCLGCEGADPTYLALFTSGTGNAYVSMTISGVQKTLNSLRAVPAGAGWTHVVATFDGDKMRIYTDSVIRATGVSTPGTVSMGTALRLGSWSGITPNWSYAGGMDEVAIYASALSPTQIAAHYAAGQPFKAALARGSNAYIGPNVPPGAMNA